MRWSLDDYDHAPIVELAEVEYAIAMDRRHQAARAEVNDAG